MLKILFYYIFSRNQKTVWFLQKIICSLSLSPSIQLWWVFWWMQFPDLKFGWHTRTPWFLVDILEKMILRTPEHIKAWRWLFTRQLIFSSSVLLSLQIRLLQFVLQYATLPITQETRQDNPFKKGLTSRDLGRTKNYNGNHLIRSAIVFSDKSLLGIVKLCGMVTQLSLATWIN